jgi:phage protein D
MEEGIVMGLLDTLTSSGAGYARRAGASITYDSVDITEAIEKYLKSLEYTDVLTGQADDLQITLEDRNGLWLESWFPEKGATLTASIKTKYWNSLTEAEKELPLGIFEIDEIECSAMPSEAKIKAVSVPNNTTLRGEEHTRAWEKYTIKKIAKDIVDKAKMELVFSAKEDPTIDRVEQSEQSDLEFLNKLCNDNGLALKVTDNQIVIFDMTELEEKEPSILFVRPSTTQTNTVDEAVAETLKQIKPSGWRFSTTIRDVYKACTVEYTDGGSKTKISYTFTDPNKKEGKTLLVKQEVKTQAEAERLAKKSLREKNQDEVTGSITCMGYVDLSAGLTVTVKDFGHFDGKYIISQVRHTLGSGYTCSVDIRKCLDGY